MTDVYDFAAKRTIGEKEIVDAFLSRSFDMIAELNRRAMGEDSLFPDANTSLLMKYFDIFKALVERSEYIGEIQKFNAQSSADIIRMLRDGKVSVRDALDLMRLVQMEFEMSELKELSDRLAGFERTDAA